MTESNQERWAKAAAEEERTAILAMVEAMALSSWGPQRNTYYDGFISGIRAVALAIRARGSKP